MLYKEIAIDIRTKITKGKLKYGDRLESEIALAKAYKTSKVTIRKSLKILVKNGFIRVVPNSGYFVNDEDMIASLNTTNAKSMHEIFKKDNINNEVVYFKKIRAEHLAEIFEIKSSEFVFHVERIRYVNNKSYLVEITYMPEYLFPSLTKRVFKDSVYQYVDKCGYSIYNNCKTMQATFLPKRFEEFPGCNLSEPVLLVTNKGYLKTGNCFEYSHSYHLNNEITIINFTSDNL